MSEQNQHSLANEAKAQQEILLMSRLRERPRTPTELSAELNLPQNRVRYLLTGLYEAECVRRVPGSHVIELVQVSA